MCSLHVYDCLELCWLCLLGVAKLLNCVCRDTLDSRNQPSYPSFHQSAVVEMPSVLIPRQNKDGGGEEGKHTFYAATAVWSRIPRSLPTMTMKCKSLPQKLPSRPGLVPCDVKDNDNKKKSKERRHPRRGERWRERGSGGGGIQPKAYTPGRTPPPPSRILLTLRSLPVPVPITALRPITLHRK